MKSLAYLAVIVLSGHYTYAANTCVDIFDIAPLVDLSALSPEQNAFINGPWKNFLGPDSTQLDQIAFRSVNANTIEVQHPRDSRRMEIQWVDGLMSPKVTHGEDVSTLQLPKNYKFNETWDLGQDVLQRLTVYSNLHPYASGRRQITLKRVQREAVQAVQKVVENNEKSFIFVAPTGVGKTVVMMEVMNRRLRAEPNGLHIVAADQNFITDQLLQNLKGLQEKLPFNLEIWGDGKSQELTSYVNDVSGRRLPTVLVTTIQTLNSKINTGAGEAANVAALTPILKTFAFDEAHHLGAPETLRTLNQIVFGEGSKAFLYGTTATPIHLDTSILKLFKASFWAYLDKPDTFLANNRSIQERLIGDTTQQLIESIKQGELSPIQSFKHLTPADGTSYFIKKNVEGDGVRYIIDPTKMSVLAEQLAESFRRHDKGFITVGTKEEANNLAAFLNAQGWGKTFAPLHTGMTSPEQKAVLRSFKSKTPDSPNFLVTIRKMDEGVDIPNMSLYVDANRTVGPRQFLQRTGRVIRIAPGKEATEIRTLSEVNELTLLDTFHDIQKQTAGSLSESPLKYTTSKVLKETQTSFYTEADQRLAMQTLHFVDITARIDAGLGRLPQVDAPTTSSEQRLYADLAALHKGAPEKVEKFYSLMPPKIAEMLKQQFFPAKLWTQWSRVTDRFIADFQRVPKFEDPSETGKLTSESEHYMALRQVLSSDKGMLFWRSLSDQSRQMLRDSGLAVEMMTIDQLLNEFVAVHHRLPSQMHMMNFRNGKEIKMTEMEAQYEQSLYGKMYRAVTYGEVRLTNLSPEALDVIGKSRIWADLIRNLPSQVTNVARHSNRLPIFGESRFENRVFRRLEMSQGLSGRDTRLGTSVERATNPKKVPGT